MKLEDIGEGTGIWTLTMPLGEYKIVATELQLYCGEYNFIKSAGKRVYTFREGNAKIVLADLGGENILPENKIEGEAIFQLRGIQKKDQPAFMRKMNHILKNGEQRNQHG